MIVNNLEDFSSGINLKIDNLNWDSKRDIIRQVVKRIELGENEINIVYRVDQLTYNNTDVTNIQHRCNRTYGSVRGQKGSSFGLLGVDLYFSIKLCKKYTCIINYIIITYSLFNCI